MENREEPGTELIRRPFCREGEAQCVGGEPLECYCGAAGLGLHQVVGGLSCEPGSESDEETFCGIGCEISCERPSCSEPVSSTRPECGPSGLYVCSFGVVFCHCEEQCAP